MARFGTLAKKDSMIICRSAFNVLNMWHTAIKFQACNVFTHRMHVKFAIPEQTKSSAVC